MSIILKTRLSLPLAHKKKVKDTYDLGNALVLIIKDRISASDYVLPCGIPDKGLELNQLSTFFRFDKTKHIIANHLITSVNTTYTLNKYLPPRTSIPRYLIGRSMIVRKAERIPVKATVRGYIAGSAWIGHQKSGTISGLPQIKVIKENNDVSSENLCYPKTNCQ